MIVDQHGKPIRSNYQLSQMQHAYRRLKARYDAAQTNSFNEDHWKNADQLGPLASHSPTVRRKLISRSRYEYENGAFTKGIVKTLANDFRGSGAKLQIIDDAYTPNQQAFIEKEFQRWAKEIKLRKVLHKIRIAKARDGEAFALLYTDETLESPVKLNIRVIECEQIGDPIDPANNQIVIDGVKFDKNMKPIAYYILHEHPGNPLINVRRPKDGQWVDARYVIHWYDQDRPYHRGIPETTPMVALAAHRRRYGLAVLTNAEASADQVIMLESELPNNPNFFQLDAEGNVEDDPFDQFPIDKGMITTLPLGMKAKGFKAEQPTSTHAEFVDKCVQEEARCVDMPFNVASGNSGGYNMSSGTLDKQLYNGSQTRQREDCEDEVLTPKVFKSWIQEAALVPSYRSVIGVLPFQRTPDHRWMWDVFPLHVDPVKEASARAIQLEMGMISDIDVQETVYGRSSEEHYAQMEDMVNERTRIGIGLPWATSVPVDSGSETESEQE